MKNERWMMGQLADIAINGEKIEITPLRLLQIELIDNVAHLYDVYSTIMKNEACASYDVSFNQFWGVYKALVAATNDKFIDKVTSDYVNDMLSSQVLFMFDDEIDGWEADGHND